MTVLSPAQQQSMEYIEKLREERMLHTKKKCQSLKMGEVNGSPDFQAVCNKLEVWDLVVQFQQGSRINPGWICRLARTVGIVSPLGCSLAEVTRAWRMTHQEYEKINLNARALQKDYLYNRVFKQQENVLKLEWKQAIRNLREEQQWVASWYLW